MATFTITTTQNIDELTIKAGGDTYNINGGKLTIDQDSRVGTNQTTSTTLGAATVSASLGGELLIDGRDIWMIPYSAGTGNVPAWNTAITRGTGTGKLIGVHSALTAASTATGAAMPATGFLRVKQKAGAYTAGALTGIGATADNAGRVGWLEIVGDEAATINANRLGQVNIIGAWYLIGTTSGASNQTMQIPSNGLLRYAAGVFIEQNAGVGDYEFYPNAGLTTTTGTEATRGKVVWISNAGLVRIGNSGAATNGFTPATGLAVVIGNLFLENCTTAARTANVIPNATIATRYDFTSTGGGVVVMDKVNAAWYLSFSQPYSVALTNVGTVDGLLLTECATAVAWSKVGVGNKPTTDLLMSPLTISYCYAGGTMTNCVWARVSHAATGAHTITLTDIDGFTFINETSRANTIKANATTYSHIVTRAKNCTWTSPRVIQGPMNFVTCDGITVTSPVYANCVSGTTVTTYATYFYLLSSNTINSTFSGGTIPVTNTQPYTALLAASLGCANIKLRSIGTRAARLNLGSTNGCGLIYSVATACFDIKVQRVYCSNTRTGGMTGDNTCKRVSEENVHGDYADAVDVMLCLNHVRKGSGGTGALTAQTAVYGTHWFDLFTSTTAGRVGVFMNEANATSAAQVTISGGAAFTAVGGLYMPTIGHQVIFETPDFLLGHTQFADSALVMAGGTATDYTYQYQINKNNGAGFSAWSADKTPTTLGTALNGETLDAALGFKLKLKLTTSTTNATAITSIYMTTVSSATAQDYQYPLDTAVTTLAANVSLVGAEIRIYDLDNSPAGSLGTELAGSESAPAATFDFTATAGNAVWIQIMLSGYEEYGQEITVGDAATTLSLILKAELNT